MGGNCPNLFRFKTLSPVFLLDSDLVKSTDDIVTNIKSSRAKIQTFNRSQSSFSILSGNPRDGNHSFPILQIVEKSESIDFDFDKILKVKEASLEDLAQINENYQITEDKEIRSREESLKEIRGVLQEKLDKSSSIRKSFI